MIAPKFFKEANNANAAEFKQCLPVGVQTSYKTIAPAIATAEQLRLLPYLGYKLFERAADYYAAHQEADTVMDELVNYIQMTVVRMAFWDSFDQLQSFMTDNGMADAQEADHRLYRYQADALRASLHRQGYEWLNKTLEFCTANVRDLPEFEASQYYTERSGSVIKGMADFEQHIGINRDFTVFAKLREWLDTAEQMELPFRIGETMYNAIHSSPLASKYIPLMRGISGFVAHWAMADAAPFLNLQPTANGLVIVSEDSNDGASKRQAPAEQVAAFAKTHRDAAERYIGQVVTYCKAHTDTYPEIEEIGTKYDTEHGPGLIDNHGKKTILVL